MKDCMGCYGPSSSGKCPWACSYDALQVCEARATNVCEQAFFLNLLCRISFYSTGQSQSHGLVQTESMRKTTPIGLLGRDLGEPLFKQATTVDRKNVPETSEPFSSLRYHFTQICKASENSTDGMF